MASSIYCELNVLLDNVPVINALASDDVADWVVLPLVIDERL